MGGGEVAFLPADGEEDVGCGEEGEEEVGDGHGGGGPEDGEPADVEGVADGAVEEGGFEGEGGVVALAEEEPDLAQAEEVEVVDEEGDGEEQGPAEGVGEDNGGAGGGGVNVPEDAAEGLPEPEEGGHGEAGEEDVGAAFGGGRDDAGPLALEPWAGHDAVLGGEDEDEEEVVDDGDERGDVSGEGPGVECGGCEVADAENPAGGVGEG